MLVFFLALTIRGFMLFSYRFALLFFAAFLLTGCPLDSDTSENPPPELPLLENTPPELQLLIYKTEFQQGKSIPLAISASDKEGAQLRISWQIIDNPSQVTLNKLSDTQAQLVVTEQLTQNIQVTVSVTVSDGNSEVSQQAEITITPNLAPEINTDSESYTFQLGEELSFPVTITDNDSQNLESTWQLIDAPEGFSIANLDGMVQLNAPSSITESVNLSAQLNVSDGYNLVGKAFSITLNPKDIIQVTLIYPPANALTDANSTTIRGVSSSELSSLSINGIAATSSDNFLTWTTSLSIAERATLSFSAESEAKITESVEYLNFSRTIKQAQPFILENESLTVFDNKVYLINDSNKQIIQHDLLTNDRVIIFQGTTDFDFEPEYAIVDDINNRLVVAGSLDTEAQYYGLTVIALDLGTWSPTVLFKDIIGEAYQSLAFNGDTNKLLIPEWHSDGTIFEIDLTTGVKTVLYDPKVKFGIELDRGYRLKYHNGDLLWGDVGTPTIYKIDQVKDTMGVIWQQSDYQTAVDDLDISLRFFEEFIYDEEANKLTLILDDGILIFDLTLKVIESHIEFANIISPFSEIEAAYLLGPDLYIWDEDIQQLITYNLSTQEYTASDNEKINASITQYPRSIELSSDEKSLYFSSEDSSTMYLLPIDATSNEQLKPVFDLSINNAIDGQPTFYFERYAPINSSETGFYMNKMYDGDGLYFFEFETLNITNISLIEDIEHELVIDFENRLAFSYTENTYHDGSNWIDEVFWKKINLDTGEVSNFSTNLDYQGTEFEYQRVYALTLTPDGQSLIAEINDNLVSISTSDGALSWLSKDKLMPNLSYNSIESFIWVDEALFVINANSNSGIYEVDLTTGDYTEISGKFIGGGATPYDFDTGVYSDTLEQFFIIDYDLKAIYAIDKITGERLIIHK